MKHLKSSIKVFLLLAALTAALHVHSQQCFECSTEPLFQFDGTHYVAVGEMGWDYQCDVSSDVCTYYRPDPVFNPNYYVPCKYGKFKSLP